MFEQLESMKNGKKTFSLPSFIFVSIYFPITTLQFSIPKFASFSLRAVFAVRPEHKNVKHSQKYIKKFSAIIFIKRKRNLQRI